MGIRPRWALKWQHALVSLIGGMLIGYPSAHALEGVWDGYCPHPYLYFTGFFVGITAFPGGSPRIWSDRDQSADRQGVDIHPLVVTLAYHARA
jgi:hypothetical protein